MAKNKTTTTSASAAQITLAATPATLAWNEIYIDPSANTRQIPHTEEQIADLMRSIAANGQAQRVLVAEPYTLVPEGSAYSYQVVAGYGRVEALHRLYGDNAEILVDILPAGTPLSLDLLSAAENYARVDPGPMDKAMMLKRVVDQYKLSVKVAGEKLGFHKTQADALSKLWGEDVQARPEIQKMLGTGEVGLRAVSDIMRETDPVRRGKLLDAIQEGKLTGTQALDKLAEWQRKDAEKAEAAEIPNGADPEPEEDKRRKKKAKPLTMRTLTLFLEELEPVPSSDNPEAEVEWDGIALVANLLREKVLPGKMSPAKFAAAANRLLYGETEGAGGEGEGGTAGGGE